MCAPKCPHSRLLVSLATHQGLLQPRSSSCNSFQTTSTLTIHHGCRMDGCSLPHRHRAVEITMHVSPWKRASSDCWLARVSSGVCVVSSHVGGFEGQAKRVVQAEERRGARISPDPVCRQEGRAETSHRGNKRSACNASMVSLLATCLKQARGFFCLDTLYQKLPFTKNYPLPRVVEGLFYL